jgi:hypothetical protein
MTIFRRESTSLVLPEMFGSKAPAAPTVLIDDSLGIPPEATGFDFDLFYDLTRTVGYTEDEIRTHTTRFSGRLTNDLAGKHRGRTSTVFIRKALQEARNVAKKGPAYVQKRYGVNIFKDSSIDAMVNEIAIHELGHDHDNLHLNGRRDTRVAVIQHLVPRLAALGCMTDMIAEMVRNQSGEYVVAPFVGMTGAIAISMLQNSFGPMVNRATEGVAYVFQEQYGDVRITDFDPVLLGKLTSQ